MSTRKANGGVSYRPQKSLDLLRQEAKAANTINVGEGPKNSKRPDGRALPALRPIFMKPGVVSRAVGSAYYEAHNTKVICSVYGPRPSQRQIDFSEEGTVNCDVKYAPFAEEGTRSADGQSVGEKELSLTVLRAIEGSIMKDKFPKSVLDVYVVVIAACGSVTAACINCASLAIVDAGVELYDIVAASSVASFLVQANVADLDKSASASEGGYQLRVDPSLVEERLAKSFLTIAQMPSLGEVTLLLQSGKVLPKELLDTTRMGLDATTLIHRMIVRSVTTGVTPVQEDENSIEDGTGSESETAKTTIQ